MNKKDKIPREIIENISGGMLVNADEIADIVLDYYKAENYTKEEALKDMSKRRDLYDRKIKELEANGEDDDSLMLSFARINKLNCLYSMCRIEDNML